MADTGNAATSEERRLRRLEERCALGAALRALRLYAEKLVAHNPKEI